MISPAQSRAARALLNWSQERLAKEAAVSRSTVVDFEAATREPLRENRVAIEEALSVNGIELVPDEGDFGEGARYRRAQLIVVGDPQPGADKDARLQLRFRGEPYVCLISREALEDGTGTILRNDGDVRTAALRLLNRIRAVAERRLVAGIEGRTLVIRSLDLQPPSHYPNRVGNALDPNHPRPTNYQVEYDPFDHD